jgi:hypothetical protein
MECRHRSCHTSLLGVVAALVEEPTRIVVAGVGSERCAVRSAPRDAWCTREAYSLRCRHPRVTAGNPLRHARRLVLHAELDLGSGLGLMRHGARWPPNH